MAKKKEFVLEDVMAERNRKLGFKYDTKTKQQSWKRNNIRLHLCQNCGAVLHSWEAHFIHKGCSNPVYGGSFRVNIQEYILERQTVF